jgi:hypothetical protein
MHATIVNRINIRCNQPTRFIYFYYFRYNMQFVYWSKIDFSTLL